MDDNMELLAFLSDDAWDDPMKLMEAIEHYHNEKNDCEEHQPGDYEELATSQLTRIYTQEEILALVPGHSREILQLIEQGKIAPRFEVNVWGAGLITCYDANARRYVIDYFGESDSEGESLYKRFVEMFDDMKMLYSYKPVLIKAILSLANSDGEAKIDDIAEYFLSFYKERRANGLVVEKSNSVFSSETCNMAIARRTVLIYPYERFRRIGMLNADRAKGCIYIPQVIWKRITTKQMQKMKMQCDQLLEEYYSKL